MVLLARVHANCFLVPMACTYEGGRYMNEQSLIFDGLHKFCYFSFPREALMLPDWTLSGFATVLNHIQPAGKSLTILLKVAFEAPPFLTESAIRWQCD